MIDRNIQTSLHGRRFGISGDNNLILNGGVVSFDPQNPMQRVAWTDDFLGDSLSGQYNFQEGSDSGTSDFAINVQQGGVARMTTGDSATLTMAGNGAQVDLGALNWKPNAGGLAFEARVKTDIITDLALFIGFTDQTAALEMPWTLSVATYTSNQTDGAGFLFDTAATVDTIRCVGVKNDVDAANVDTANAWAVDTWTRFRVEIDELGTATFFINGLKVAQIANACTITAPLVPVIAGFARATTPGNIDFDYWRVENDRA